MLSSRYMTTTKNLSAIMQKIMDGTAPPRSGTTIIVTLQNQEP